MHPATAVTAPAKTDRAMEFVPFGAVDKIKLSVALVQNTVCIPTKSGRTCTERDAIRFMMLCQAQRLNPFAGDCFLCGYDGKNGPVFSLITAHQAFLKRAETCEGYEGMESGIILVDENNLITEREGDFKLTDEKCVGGWAKVYRAGRRPTYRRLSIAAMIPNYETPFWGEHKAPGQIVKCAEADALRATFPTLLGGLHTGGEISPMVDISASAGEILAAAQQSSGSAAQISAQSEMKPAQVDGGTRGQAPPSEPAESSTERLSNIVLNAGHTFDDFRKWAVGSGQPGAEDWGSFDEVPQATALGFTRAKGQVLLKSLADMKGGQ